MTMPKPSDGHLVLEKLSGTWEGEETMYPSQWDPEGGVAVGRNRNRLTLGHGGPGMHVRMTYDLSTPGTMKGKMEMSPDGAVWRVLFEATYRRL